MYPFELTKECLDAAEGNLPAKRARSLRVFQNEFVERYLAQAHPITPGIWFGPVIGVGLWRGESAFGAGKTAALFAGGVLLVSFVEYALHRWGFHFAANTKAERLRLFLAHGYHHAFPDDPRRLVLPPLAIWPVAAILIPLWYVVFGRFFWPVLAGSATGYVAYDWVHYATHHFRPRTPLGRWLKRYHMLHHHDLPGTRYGITSPLWDLVFGTYLPTTSLARREPATAKNRVKT